MSQATVREGIHQYLLAQQIAGVAGIFRGIPTFVSSAAWALPPGESWAAVICINLDRYDESRITLSAPNPYVAGQPVGQKERVYDVSLIVQQMYLEAANDGDPAEYVDMIDTLLEAIVAAIHADPTLGTAGNPIFEAGQDEAGLSVEMDVPQPNEEGYALFAWNRITFKLTEIITA